MDAGVGLEYKLLPSLVSTAVGLLCHQKKPFALRREIPQRKIIRERAARPILNIDIDIDIDAIIPAVRGNDCKDPV